MSKKISTLAPGNLVKLNENGVAKKFIFLQYNHYGKGEVVLLRKDSFATKAFKGGSNGYNGYNGSDIDMFCNAEYIQTLDPAIRACLVDVPIPTCVGAAGNGTVDSTVKTLYRKGFLLSCNEVAGQNSIGVEGTVFSYLNTQANRIAYYDETSVAVYWWLRSPDSNAISAYNVDTGGSLNYVNVYNAKDICPRPALALSSEILVSNSPDGEGCYTIDDVAIAGEQFQKVNGVWRRMC